MKLDRKQLTEQAVTHGRTGVKAGVGFAIKAGVIYIVLVLLGLIGGGFGAVYGAAHFGYGGWWSTLAATLGTVAGGVGGFFLAHIIILGLIQDMLLDAGIEAGKIGYRAAMKKIAEKKAKDAGVPPAACVIFLLGSLLCLPQQAGASSCYTPPPAELIRESALIFKGTAVEQRKIEGEELKPGQYDIPNAVIVFDVSTVYKGPEAKKIEMIQMRDLWGAVGIKTGHEYIIFSDAERKIYNCAPIIDMTAEKERREKWYAEHGYELRDNLDPMPSILDDMKARQEEEAKSK